MNFGRRPEKEACQVSMEPEMIQDKPRTPDRSQCMRPLCRTIGSRNGLISSRDSVGQEPPSFDGAMDRQVMLQ